MCPSPQNVKTLDRHLLARYNEIEPLFYSVGIESRYEDHLPVRCPSAGPGRTASRGTGHRTAHRRRTALGPRRGAGLLAGCGLCRGAPGDAPGARSASVPRCHLRPGAGSHLPRGSRCTGRRATPAHRLRRDGRVGLPVRRCVRSACPYRARSSASGRRTGPVTRPRSATGQPPGCPHRPGSPTLHR